MADVGNYSNTQYFDDVIEMFLPACEWLKENEMTLISVPNKEVDYTADDVNNLFNEQFKDECPEITYWANGLNSVGLIDFQDRACSKGYAGVSLQNNYGRYDNTVILAHEMGHNYETRHKDLNITLVD